MYGMDDSAPCGEDDGALAERGKLEGVVIGILVGFGGDRRPLVAFPGSRADCAVPANTTAHLTPEHVGREVALLFEDADPLRPLVIGPIRKPDELGTGGVPRVLSVEADEERIVLSADKEIVIRCGKASITLTRAGKVIVRGTYLMTRSTGANCIKGGSVQIN